MDIRYSRTRHSSSVWYLPSRIYIMARNNLSQQLKNKQVRSYNFLLTDRSETFKANGEASFNRFSAKVHHSSSNLAASLSWLHGRLSFKAYGHCTNFQSQNQYIELNKLNHTPSRTVRVQWMEDMSRRYNSSPSKVSYRFHVSFTINCEMLMSRSIKQRSMSKKENAAES